jgi:DNA-binding transcriptional LysR family regulator
MSFNLDHLRYIRAICAAGSFRKAAEQLGINQPIGLNGCLVL